ncbi:MAG: thioredoxin family protein [Planctomycetota bacterium]|nr:thioredoxin family protein [Planctomycetota bacterium]
MRDFDFTSSIWLQAALQPRRITILMLALQIAALGSLARGQGFGGMQGGFGGEKSVTVSAELKLNKDGKTAQLAVTAKLGAAYHIYSMTQPPGGPLPTRISVPDKRIKITSEFTPDRNPEVHQDEAAFPGIDLEEFYESVTWTAKVELVAPFAASADDLKLNIDGLVCSGACIPFNEDVKVSVTGAGAAGTTTQETKIDSTPKAGELTQIDESEMAPPSAVAEVPPQFGFESFGTGNSDTDSSGETLRAGKSHSVWSAMLVPASVKAGATAVIELKAINDPGYHVYDFRGDDEINLRTVIIANEKSGLKVGTPVTSAHLEDAGLGAKYHDGEVVWQIPVQVPEGTKNGDYPLELLVRFNTCNASSCDPPQTISARGALKVGKAAETAVAMTLSTADKNAAEDSPILATSFDAGVALPAGTIVRSGTTAPDSAVDLAADEDAEAESEDDEYSFAFTLAIALVAGFILNFMPCVLPVLGLKVMSFANQAGNSHARVVGLNLAYVAGILAVFLVLAGLTIGAQQITGSAFGWGQQFTYLWFKVFLACLMFAMALSFLGVWEIPIPGFATSNKSSELMEKDGMLGAFFKGGLTTVLATPCSGPLLGWALGASLTFSSTQVLLMYLTIGLGLSSPFIVLCFYPKFVEQLPKPGAWMDTLKQVLAFPLLLTAVFFVQTIEADWRIATLTMLIFVWFSCWLIGKVPVYESADKRLKAWSSAIVATALGGVIGFGFMGPSNSELDWVPYDEAQLKRFRAEGKTVMLDFTANWCLNCKYNTRYAIEVQNVVSKVEENNVVTMLADWTSRDEAIGDKLKELKSNSIPLMAIYPPGSDSKPIILRDILSESTVLKALEQAGPSVGSERLTSAPISP